MKDTVYSTFAAQAAVHPDTPAIITSEATISYHQLLNEADRIAACLPESYHNIVGIVTDHGPLMIAAMLAVLKTGSAYVPVEPSFPDGRIDFIMNECNADFIITTSKYSRRFPGKTVFNLDYISDAGALSTTPDQSKADGLAYVLYTSGSTGRPKGVMISNANVCHYARAFENEFHSGPGDVMLQYSVCTFDIFVEEVFTTLLNGAALAIPSEEEKKDIPSLMDFVSRNGVTIISGFPYLLMELDKLPSIPSSLRLLISGGDVLRESFVHNLLPKVDVYNTYGPSEITVCCSYFKCNGAKAQPDGTFPVGKPVIEMEILLLDDSGNPVPQGEPGEICIIGEGVSKGYIGNRAKENEAFVTLPDGRRMYRSGDLGMMLPDGNIHFLRRKDSQVMILGKRVEPEEVQNVLCECCGVENGAVVAHNDTKGLAYLTAYFVPERDEIPDVDEIKACMARFLPSYMIPEFFVQLVELPLNSNGKLDKKRLPIVLKSATI